MLRPWFRSAQRLVAPHAAVAASLTVAARRWQNAPPSREVQSALSALVKARADFLNGSRCAADAQNAAAALRSAALVANEGTTDFGCFVATLMLSADLMLPDHLNAIGDGAQRFAAQLNRQHSFALCSLLAEFPTMRKAPMLSGMVAQKLAAVIPDMTIDQLCMAFVVFAAAGPLGEPKCAAIAARLETVMKDQSAAPRHLFVVASSLSAASIKVPSELLDAVDAALRRLVVPAADAPIDFQTRVRALTLLLRPLYLSRPGAHQQAETMVSSTELWSAAPDADSRATGMCSVMRAFVSSLGSMPPLAAGSLGKHLSSAAQQNTVSAASSLDVIRDWVAALKEVAEAARSARVTWDAPALEPSVYTAMQATPVVKSLLGADTALVMQLSRADWEEGGNIVSDVLTGGAPSDDGFVALVQQRSAAFVDHCVAQKPPLSGYHIAAFLHSVSMTDPALDKGLPGLIGSFAAGFELQDWIAILKRMSVLSEQSLSVARDCLRSNAQLLAAKVSDATAAELSVVSTALATIRLRAPAILTAIAERFAAVKETASIDDLVRVFDAFSRLDARQSKVFYDSVVDVRRITGRANAAQAATLLHAFARSRVWLYKVYARLAERLCEVAHEWTVLDMKRALSGLHRVDIRHKGFLDLCIARLNDIAEQLPMDDQIAFLAALSKLGAWDVKLYEDIGRRAVAVQAQLDAEKVAELLLAFSRVGLQSRWLFDDLTLRCIAVAPTAPPHAAGNIVTAFAAMRIAHTELFTVVGERITAVKQDCPSVTIAAVLVAFSTVGLKDDKLFIEMIPRVRFVAHHGTAQDVTNVLTAYTAVGLWHYKLFVRLAERAIQLRAELSAEQVAQILHAFAKVEMRYEKLFIELSPRVQIVSQTASPSVLASVANSYAIIKANDHGVLNAIANRAGSTVATFDVEEAKLLVGSLKRLGFERPDMVQAFVKKFGAAVEQVPSSLPPQSSAPPTPPPDGEGVEASDV